MKEKVARILSEAQSIACFYHKNPDGDALGSALAVKNHFGEKVRVYGYGRLPELFSFLPGYHEIVRYESFSEVEPAEVYLVVDCGDESRVPGFDPSKAKEVVVIDHHETNTGFGHHNIVEPERASTAEIVYDVLKLTNAPVSRETALCIYTGLYTDTGGFKYSSTCAETFETAKELVELGVVPWEVASAVYESNPVRRMRLLALCLSTLRLYVDGKVAVLYVKREMYEKTGALPEDTEDFVNYARSIKGVEVGVFVRELEEGGVKVSLRSKSHANVARVASALGGGGHYHAAGCELDGVGVEEAIERLVELLEAEIKGGGA